MTDALNKLADHYGIFPSFKDLDGNIQATNPETQLALLHGNGVIVDNDAMIKEHLASIKATNAQRRLPDEIIITSNQTNSIFCQNSAEWLVSLEGGGEISGRASGHIILPMLPTGIHQFTVKFSSHTEAVSLICAPKRAPSIQNLSGKHNIWGINTALYALNSSSNYGMGSFDNLAVAAEAFAAQGADFMGINPVHAIGWAEGVISPYSPSHRAFLNPAYIALNAPKTPMNRAEYIDYDTTKTAHQHALETAFKTFIPSQNYKSFCQEFGTDLELFALYEALSETNGPDWQYWPLDMQSPDQISAVHKAKLSERIEFHKWLQFESDQQLANVQQRAQNSGMSMGLYLDLAVGSRRGGAETWAAKAAIADGVSIGAPPDHLSPAGQNWGLTAYAPAKSKVTKYSALRQSLRASMRHASVLRIDHVLGMNRSYWLPDNGAAGGYIKQPFESILAVIAIEAERAQTAVVGEDLGLVPYGFRDTMRARGLYSYSVLQYDKDEAGEFKPHAALNPQTLACFSTHDTPTLKGFYQQTDMAWWQKLGWIAPEKIPQAKQQREYEIESILTAAKQPKSSDYEGFRDRINTILATSPATMIAVSSDDVFEIAQAPNLPGTIHEHPNWRRRNPVKVEDFAKSIKLENIGTLMRKSKRGQ